jgi:hypothetical protein
MIPRSFFVSLAYLLAVHAVFAAEPKSLFNGKDLSGWEGLSENWSVEDGAITGRNTAEAPLKDNTFLVWADGEVDDFRLKLQYRIVGGNSGVQYRSKVLDPKLWIVGGYQADIDAGPDHTGILYDEKGRGTLAPRGQRVKIAEDGAKEAETFADAAELLKVVRDEDWNDYVIEARGQRLRHYINDTLMSEAIDADRKDSEKRGVLALQVHRGDPMTVQFRKLELERLDAKSADYVPKKRKS